jgi:hypothetical protein
MLSSMAVMTWPSKNSTLNRLLEPFIEPMTEAKPIRFRGSSHCNKLVTMALWMVTHKLLRQMCRQIPSRRIQTTISRTAIKRLAAMQALSTIRMVIKLKVTESRRTTKTVGETGILRVVKHEVE